MDFRVETQIPFGNACDLELTSLRDTLMVAFAADPHGGPETLWFCFRLVALTTTAHTSVRSIRLVLKHACNMLGGQDPFTIRPVVRYDDGAWRRLDAGDLVPLPDGRTYITWEVDAPQRTLDVAFCYPYGMDDVRALVAETDGYWHMDTIGVSQHARPLVRLSNDYGYEGADRPGLYLIARQHSGETPGSWVLDGFLRYLATLGDQAPLVWAIPLANIDGVEEGDYGKDNFPYDLNRAWGRPPMRHEISVYQRDMARWRNRCRPVLGIDFHAPGATERSGVYAHLPDPETDRAAYDAALPWAEWTSAALSPRFAATDFARVPRYSSRWETPSFRLHGWTRLGIACITYETPYALAGELVLTQEHYREIGRRIAQGVLEGLEHYQHQRGA